MDPADRNEADPALPPDHHTYPAPTHDMAAVHAIVVTASDGVAAGTRNDRSGGALEQRLLDHGATDVGRAVVRDDVDEIAAAIRTAVGDGATLVVVTGGTGLGPRDVTPEAIATLTNRLIPGMGEVMRATGRRTTPRADLSRSLGAALDRTLVLAVPGSPAGATQSFDAVVGLVPHVLRLLAGDTAHAPGPDGAAAAAHDSGAHHATDHDHDDHGPDDHEHDDHGHDASCDVAHGAADDADEVGTLMAVFASPLAAVLLAWGRELGYDVVLVDPARPARDDDEGLRVVADPATADATTDVIVTDHHRDELVDMLDVALDTRARFIGLMGSRRHEGPHVGPLTERGRSASDLDRIVRPIGIDIGSRTPAEIALSTLADLVARRRGVRG